MTRRPLLGLTLALAVLANACTPDAGTATTTTSPPPPVTEHEPPGASEAATTTQPSGADRVLDRVECDDPPESVAIVCEVYDLIQANYVDPIDDGLLAAGASQALEELGLTDSTDTLVCAVPAPAFSETCQVASVSADQSEEGAEAMVRGMAAFALDPNSAYLDPRSVALRQEEEDGEVEGIGAFVSPEDETIAGEDKRCGVVSTTCRIRIVSTIAGAPAEQAGLQTDDVIVAVDRRSILGWSIDEVTATVRGPAGTDVVLTIDRAGEVFDVAITRAAVIVPLIQTERFGEVGYIRLSSFGEGAGDRFETAIARLLGEGVDQLVIDLRDNPGGLLTTAIQVTSVFLPDGNVVVTQTPDEDIPYAVSGAAVVPGDMRVIFVVNRASASASEVVSAVLQEEGLVTVVGENTFGKNTVQQQFGLSNGGALKLTTARWVTPGGHDFGGVGVTPDVEMSLDGFVDPEDLVEAVLAVA